VLSLMIMPMLADRSVSQAVDPPVTRPVADDRAVSRCRHNALVADELFAWLPAVVHVRVTCATVAPSSSSSS
jgi:hypothetical protein